MDSFVIFQNVQSDKNMQVYFILDPVSKAVKIGKANNVYSRIPELQTGNPNPLQLIHYIDCESEEQSFLLERKLHNKYEDLRLVGEWFTYDEKVFQELFKEQLDFQRKSRRNPLLCKTVFGYDVLDVKDFPCCFFYPHLTAQIMTNYENALNLSNPFRTMEYPTEGKQMILPYSDKTDRVFISDRKHKENIKLKNYQKMKQLEIERNKPSTLLDCWFT